VRQDKLNEAIAYLRSRKKYVADVGCKFVPTKPVQTDVAETIRKYRLEVEQISPVQLVKKKR
jgi:hypothetical protein